MTPSSPKPESRGMRITFGTSDLTAAAIIIETLRKAGFVVDDRQLKKIKVKEARP